MVSVNVWAILLCGVAAMALGSLWYGPLFREKWLQSGGFTSEQLAASQKMSMPVSYALMFLGSLLMATVFAHMLVYANAYQTSGGIMAGMQGALWLWLGLVAPVTIGVVLWEQKPWTYWFITAGYYLALLIIMGTILGAWPAAV